MGFKSDQLRTENKLGAHILYALKPFCGSSTTPLRQLCGTLTCLSKRAPKSLGDLFGFYWQVTGQLFNDVKTKDSDPSSHLLRAIATLLSKLTTVESNLLYATLTANVKAIGSHFFGLSWHCHRKNSWRTDQRKNASQYCNDHNSSTVCDLMSLYDSECSGTTCGKYLEPLGISSGATFANKDAYTYLSWAAYLTDDLYESFQDFLDTFNGQTCKGCNNGCSHSSASSSTCQCPSVVDCANVLPHLYSSGFSFHNAFWLRGMTWEGNTWKKNQPNKRTCANFHSQLQSVLAENAPLAKLLESIDDFLFLFRYYFLGNLSGFWAIYMSHPLHILFPTRHTTPTLTPETHFFTRCTTPGPTQFGQASTHHETHVHREVRWNRRQCSPLTSHDHNSPPR
ncbi:extracellular matrix-binding ebh, putative [Babesia caballi]|uniref:Extracellular matrix-binding ebh, putative n=1 Tax=Babesia caballi TaxID=5871 RepID=A0AAV4LR85_BABCB|nr:extracellular matrix-binding ebh, putative [Babesia caballi]